MKKFFEALLSSPLFSGVPENKLDGLLKSIKARAQTYFADETIFIEGSPASQIGIVLSGTVMIVRTDYYGNRSIVACVEPGELFGESFAFSQIEELPVSAVAGSRSEVLLIDFERLIGITDDELKSQIIKNLLRVVSFKNLALNRKIEIISKRTTREKLIAFLMYYAKKCGKNEFDIPYNRQELADFLEVERSAMSAEISRMKKDGILQTRKNHFVLFSADGKQIDN